MVVRQWLARHPRLTFHFTPTSASWLNAVEGFFAKLTRVTRQRTGLRSHGGTQYEAYTVVALGSHRRRSGWYVHGVSEQDVRASANFTFMSCCRFDGRLVKLVPPCVRTQQD